MKDDKEWMPVKGFESLYSVHPSGLVRSDRRGVTLKGRIDKYGYKRVILYDGKGHYKNKQVHRLVAESFIPNPDNKPQVDHIDTIRTNNDVSNLRWVTYKENNLNAITRERYKTMSRAAITLETRKKMSLAKKGKHNPLHSEETKRKMSESRKKWWNRQKEIRKED